MRRLVLASVILIALGCMFSSIQAAYWPERACLNGGVYRDDDGCVTEPVEGQANATQCAQGSQCPYMAFDGACYAENNMACVTFDTYQWKWETFCYIIPFGPCTCADTQTPRRIEYMDCFTEPMPPPPPPPDP